MQLVAKTFNVIIQTSFEELFDLLLEVFVLLCCAKPRFSHEDDKEMASGGESNDEGNVTEGNLSDIGIKIQLHFIHFF